VDPAQQPVAFADGMQGVKPVPVDKHVWDYDRPDNWKQSFSSCDGIMQSPIDLVTKRKEGELLEEKPTAHESLKVEYYPMGGRFTTNTGRNIQINGEFGSLFLPDGEYAAKEINFHFPSEHTIDGDRAEGEMHIVHQKVGSTGLKDIAVVALLFKERIKWGSDATDRNQELGFMTQLGFGSAPTPRKGGLLPFKGKHFPIQGSVDLAATYNYEMTGGFYHYQGSFTTPPCTEGVHWYVLQRPALITGDMIRHFHEVLAVENSRPIQKGNDREIALSDLGVPGEFKNPTSPVHSSAWAMQPVFALSGALLLLLSRS